MKKINVFHVMGWALWLFLWSFTIAAMVWQKEIGPYFAYFVTFAIYGLFAILGVLATLAVIISDHETHPMWSKIFGGAMAAFPYVAPILILVAMLLKYSVSFPDWLENGVFILFVAIASLYGFMKTAGAFFHRSRRH